MAPTSGDCDASSSLSVDGGYSEYSDDDCPDEEGFIDSANDGDEIIQAVDTGWGGWGLSGRTV